MAKVIVVSACLGGFRVAYDGKSCFLPELMEKLGEAERLLFVCPEVEAFGCPRLPLELTGPAEEVFAGKAAVLRADGVEVTEKAKEAAQKAFRLVSVFAPAEAYLKERSPFCGVHRVYNGKFTGKLLSGRGLFAHLLAESGIPLKGVE